MATSKAELFIKSAIKSVLRSALVMGAAMLAWQVSAALGSLVMLGGSFLLMFLSYSKEWRLHWVTCLLPPLAAGGSYLMQLSILDLQPDSAVLTPAIIVGVVIGLLRGLTHKTFVRAGGVFAKRSVFFLLIWAISYGVTQLFTLARSQGMVSVGLAGGAFSTALLAVASLILLFKYAAKRGEAAMAPVGGAGRSPVLPMVLMLLCGLLAPLTARAQTQVDEAQQLRDIARDIVLDSEVDALGLGRRRSGVQTAIEDGFYVHWYQIGYGDPRWERFSMLWVSVGSSPSVAENRKFVEDAYRNAQEVDGVHAETIPYGDFAYKTQQQTLSTRSMICQGRYRLMVQILVSEDYSTLATNEEVMQKSQWANQYILDVVYPRFCQKIGVTPKQSGSSALFEGVDSEEVKQIAETLLVRLGGKDSASPEVRRMVEGGATASAILLLASLLANLVNTTGASLTQAADMLAAQVVATGRLPSGGVMPPPPIQPISPPPLPPPLVTPPPLVRTGATPPSPPVDAGTAQPSEGQKPPPDDSGREGDGTESGESPPEEQPSSEPTDAAEAPDASAEPTPTDEATEPVEPAESAGPAESAEPTQLERNEELLANYRKFVGKQEYSADTLKRFQDMDRLAEAGDYGEIEDRFRQAVQQQIDQGQAASEAEQSWAAWMGWGETAAKVTVAASKSALVVLGGHVAGGAAAGAKIIGITASAVTSGAISAAESGAEAQVQGKDVGEIIEKTGAGFLSGAKDGAVSTFTNLPKTKLLTKVLLPAATEAGEIYLRTGSGTKAITSAGVEVASNLTGAGLDNLAPGTGKFVAETLLGGTTAGAKNVYVNGGEFQDGFNQGILNTLAGKAGGAAAGRGAKMASDYTSPMPTPVDGTELRPLGEGEATARLAGEADDADSRLPIDADAGEGRTPISGEGEGAPPRLPADAEPTTRVLAEADAEPADARLRRLLDQSKADKRQTIDLDQQAPVTREMVKSMRIDTVKDGDGNLVFDADGNPVTKTYVDPARALEQLQDPAASRTAKQLAEQYRGPIIETRDDILYAPADARTIRETQARLQAAAANGETDLSVGENQRLRMDTFSTPGAEGKSLGADRDARLVLDTVDPATGRIVDTTEVPRKFWEDQAYKDFHDHTTRLAKAAGKDITPENYPRVFRRIEHLQYLKGQGLSDEQIAHRAWAEEHNQLFTDAEHVEASADNADQVVRFDRTPDGELQVQRGQGRSNILDAQSGAAPLKDAEGYRRMWQEKSEFYVREIPSEAVAQSQKGIAEYLKLRQGYQVRNMEPPPIRPNVANAMEVIIKAPTGVDATPAEMARVQQELQGLGFRDMGDAMTKIAHQNELLKWSRSTAAPLPTDGVAAAPPLSSEGGASGSPPLPGGIDAASQARLAGPNVQPPEEEPAE